MTIIHPSGHGFYRICTKSQGWIGPTKGQNMQWIDHDGTILRQTDPWTKHAKNCGDFNRTKFVLLNENAIAFECDYPDILCYISRDVNEMV